MSLELYSLIFLLPCIFSYILSKAFIALSTTPSVTTGLNYRIFSSIFTSFNALKDAKSMINL